ncbi:MAG: hypothetical protein EXR98_02020 [Gemmataceae bacterium]|nr:hypothetical protein [Gemmataceae bacterium]
MAKSKTKQKTKTKQLDDEDELQVKSKADADADDVDAVDVETDDADAEDVDVDDADAADVDADAGDDDDDEPSVDEGPTAPPAKITKLVIALILLNWIAAPTFLFLAVIDNNVRMQYAHRTLLNYIQIWGLPLDDEQRSASLSMDTRPRTKLTSEQVKEVVNKRIRKSYSDYAAVDEPVPLRIRPSDMSEAVLADVFRESEGIPDPVPTLDAEIKRLKDSLPGEIEKAAAKVLEAQKSDDDKRAIIQKTLLSIAWGVKQVRDLDDMLAKTKGADLDRLVTESVQRRIYYDILAPLNVFRPGEIKDAKNYKIEKLSDQSYTLDQVKSFLIERLDHALADEYKAETHIGEDFISEKKTTQDVQTKKELSSLTRGSVEKRQKIGFILFTLGHVSVPTLDVKLYPKGVERAQVVSGLYEFTSSSLRYVQALQILEERIVSAIKADRAGYMLAADKGSTPGATAEIELEIDRLVKLVELIDSAQKRLDDLRDQKDKFQKIFEQRTQQHKDTIEKLRTARGDTEKYVKELRVLQEQLHKALVELSDAGERNFRLLDEITAIERAMQKKNAPKGGKK